MPQRLEPIETPVGIIRGRDGFYLDDVHFEYGKGEVRFSGDVNGNLCSRNPHNQDWIAYLLVFSDVLEFSMTEVDFAADVNTVTAEHERDRSTPDTAPLVLNETSWCSSFAKVVESERLNRMRRLDSANKVTSAYEHYILYTYDHIFEIICLGYQLTVKNDPAAQ